MAYTKQKIIPRDFKMNFPPSERQVEIENLVIPAIESRTHNNTCAVAGAGKSTLAHYLAFIAIPKRIFKARMGGVTILYTSFANAIVDSVRPLYEGKKGLQADGMHKICFRACREHLGSFGRPDGYKVNNLLSESWPALFDYRNATNAQERAERTDRHFAMAKLIHFVKVTLTDPKDRDAVMELVWHFNALEGMNDIDVLVDLVPDVMEKNDLNTKTVDFDDMIYFVWRFDLPLPQYDLVIGDENQDYSKMMHHAIQKMSRSFLGIGDEFQAIYGFAGADCDSVRSLVNLLHCHESLLDVNYRCGSDIIKVAQTYNPIIQPWEKSPTGCVKNISYQEALERFEPGDMIECRLNSPLIKPCWDLVKRGKAATIKGQDVSGQIITLHKRVAGKATTIADADSRLQEYHDRETARLDKRKNCSQSSYEVLDNKVDALRQFYDICSEEGEGPDQVEKKIKAVFSKDAKKNAINFTTVHGAKGLEADRVFVLESQRLQLAHPKQKPWEVQQEKHLAYVAVTRAKQELNLVDCVEK